MSERDWSMCCKCWLVFSMDSKGSSEKTDSKSGMWRWVKNMPPPLPVCAGGKHQPWNLVWMFSLPSKRACHKMRPKAHLPGCTDCATATTLLTNGVEGHLLSYAAITDSASMGRKSIHLHSTSLCFTWLVTPWTSFAWSVFPRNTMDLDLMPIWNGKASLGSASLYQLSFKNVWLFPIHRNYLWMKIKPWVG